jgi:hypothetical protein
MSQLHQINLGFDPEQDRLLLRISTTEGEEHALWLTRRLVKAWWPVLVEVAGRSGQVPAQPMNPAAAVFEFAHERALRAANFELPYAAAARSAAPMLASTVHMRALGAGSHELVFAPRQGGRVTLTLAGGLLHALLKLVQDAVAQADWAMNLELPAGCPPGGRRLN